MVPLGWYLCGTSRVAPEWYLCWQTHLNGTYVGRPEQVFKLLTGLGRSTYCLLAIFFSHPPTLAVFLVLQLMQLLAE
jgi:hypothetical protein